MKIIKRAVAVAAIIIASLVATTPASVQAHGINHGRARAAMKQWIRAGNLPVRGRLSGDCAEVMIHWQRGRLLKKGQGQYHDPTPFVPDPNDDDNYVPLYSREQRPDLYHVNVDVRVQYLWRKIGGSATDPHPGMGYVHRDDGFWYLDAAPVGYSLHRDPDWPDGRQDYYYLDDPRAAMEAGLPVGEWAYVSLLDVNGDFYTYFDPTPPTFDTNHADDKPPPGWTVKDRYKRIRHAHGYKCQYTWNFHTAHDYVLVCEILVYNCSIEDRPYEDYCNVDLLAVQRKPGRKIKVRMLRKTFAC